MLKERDSALQEVQMWRSELGKARGNAVILEAAVVRAEEKARISAADADIRVKEAVNRLESAAKEKEDLLALANVLRSQIKRFDTHYSIQSLDFNDWKALLNFITLKPKLMGYHSVTYIYSAGKRQTQYRFVKIARNSARPLLCTWKMIMWTRLV